MNPKVLSWVVTVLVACSGDDGTKDPDTGTTESPTTDTGPAVEQGDPVIVIAGPSFMPTRTSDVLTATIYNTDVTDITWTSDAEGVLTVDDQGAVSALTPGIAVVTAEITVDGAAIQDTLGIVVDNEIPYYDAWRGSGHARYDAEAFVHWNEDGMVPESCARCHSTFGYRDYLGADGSAVESVDAPAPLGSAVECVACHNEAADELDFVTFPSGVTIEDLGPEARCMTCHQGRTSGDDVDEAIASEGLVGMPDTPDPDLSFVNQHYYPAGATLYAGQVRGGYQYAGQVYDWRFRHVDTANTCLGCHDQHSLELRFETCARCHDDPAVEDIDDVRNIRMLASRSSDYDGDGDTDEGIYFEIRGLRDEVLDSLQQYNVDQGLDQVCYGDGYPYFFVDTDGDRSCSEAEAAFPNRYASWTPRSLAAAYNYQVATTDPGNFAHNAKYTIQLLHDSLRDLNLGLTAPKDLSAFERDDPGHFNGAGEAARHWDEDAEVSASCSRCHGGQPGLEFYLTYGVGLQGEEPDNGLECQTCHVGLDDATPDITQIRRVDDVTFPNDVTVSLDPTSNLCMTCHSGRQTQDDVDSRIDSGSLRFVNIHYRAAGATAFGVEAGVGYQYADREYAGRWDSHPPGNSCNTCHDPVATSHSFLVDDAITVCQACHAQADAATDIRLQHTGDYDGDSDSDEPLADELAAIADDLLDQIWVSSGNQICYGDAYPYFFTDLDVSGPYCDPSEIGFTNGFGAWTAPLLKAVFNWQFWHTEPGAWAHNFDYMAQLLIDSIEDLGGDVDGYERPEVAAEP